MQEKILKFPRDFLWGASTSAYQIEGNNLNDWSFWEKNNALKVAQNAENKFGHLDQIWPLIKNQAQNPQNYISGKAIDHYNQYESDFKLMQSLGLNAYRFSLEWSRIQPKKNVFDQNALKHYKKMLRNLKNLDIEPFVCLYHWPLPVWLSDAGGWQNPEIVNYFQKYVEFIAKGFKDKVKYWVTLNEPIVYSYESYFKGSWPPQKKGFLNFYGCVKKLLKAHKIAYKTIKNIVPDAKIGIAKNNIHFESKNKIFINTALKKIMDWAWNDNFLNQIDAYQDFIGLNHYFHNLIDLGLDKNENKIISDLGWELYPQSIFHVLIDLKGFKKPVYILENGLADLKDIKRKWFISESLQYVHQAITAGVNVCGYFHWSLFDNFEWDKGCWPRFGLVEIDYPSLKRKIRQSALFYTQVIKQNGVSANKIDLD